MFCKELKKVLKVSKDAAKICSQYIHNSSQNKSNTQAVHHSKSKPAHLYNHGLSGKGKSKRVNLLDLPTIQGEVVFGLHPVCLALQAGRRDKFYTLYINNRFLETEHDNATISKIIEITMQKRIPIQPTSKAFLDQLAGNRPHQGVCLDVDELNVPEWAEDTEICRSFKHMPLWLLLHNVQDPMNVGAILRTAHYLGMDKVVVSALDSCRLSPVVSKASAGAMEVIDLIRLPKYTSEIGLCEWWQSRGWEVVGTAIDEEMRGDCKPCSLYDFSPTRPIMVLLGNEGTGLNPALVRICDKLITIPSHEKSQTPHAVGSLNVSVAAGILLHWLRVSSLKEK
ncbi:rRNA methyltransferase 1, mitochondrial [Plakobranchus ocellatus]|uniref:rRNA methyltransferase 1, mitochondrial n=1 Tax=Plakobranchus ocellatus TaxID=259542 RepID=A0AAV4DFZ8_9GAST|nr:rRNA methyltransferase 1, mitochondrial [Plakobranchus ocellatus]